MNYEPVYTSHIPTNILLLNNIDAYIDEYGEDDGLRNVEALHRLGQLKMVTNELVLTMLQTDALRVELGLQPQIQLFEKAINQTVAVFELQKEQLNILSKLLNLLNADSSTCEAFDEITKWMQS